MSEIDPVVVATCETCRFYRPMAANMGAYRGSCHLRAPIMECVAKGADRTSFASTDGIWPRVRADDWCGEYLEKSHV